MIVVACVAALAVSAYSQRSTGAKFALLVGIDEYDDEDISRLSFAVKNVKAVAAALTDSLVSRN